VERLARDKHSSLLLNTETMTVKSFIQLSPEFDIAYAFY
jgi:hypothetical protein